MPTSLVLKEPRRTVRCIIPLLTLAITPLTGQAQTALQQLATPSDVGSTERAEVEQCRTPTALVLSGGGAWGLIHVGVIQALDERGIRPDVIVGASMGAIVGAMYASGYTGDEIVEIMIDLPLESIFGGYEPRMPRPLAGLPILGMLRQRAGGRLSIFAPLTREAEAHILLNAWLLRPNLLAGGDFTSLPIPLQVVATSLETQKPIILTSGDLAAAVRGSVAIPLIFTPVEIDGGLVVDGSLSATLPVEQARSLGAERLIISDATDRLEDADLDLESTVGMAATLAYLLFSQDAEIMEGDLLIRPDLRGFGKLDFSPEAKSALIQAGYEAAVEAIGQADCLPLASENWRDIEEPTWGGISPDAPRSTLVDDLDGATRPWLGETLVADRMSELRDAIMDAERASDDRLTLNPSRDDSGRVVLEPQTRQAARRFLGVGGAYDHELGFSGWVGAVDRGLFGRDWVGSATAVAGGLRQELELSLRGAASPRTGVTPLVSATVGHEDVRRFDPSGVEISALSVRMLSGFVGPELTVAREWTLSAGVRLDVWSSEEAPGTRSTVGIAAHLERAPDRNATSVRADARWSGAYGRFSAEVQRSVRLGPTTITPEVRVGWGRDLPSQLELPLGGNLGFPGLHIGEGRGDREIMFRVGARHPVAGPIHLRLEVASGVIDGNGPSVPADQWLLGARVGLGIDTFFGPITAGYGWMDNDREALFVRVGTWF